MLVNVMHVNVVLVNVMHVNFMLVNVMLVNVNLRGRHKKIINISNKANKCASPN